MNEMRKLMETLETINEGPKAPAFEIGVPVYVLYDTKKGGFAVSDMGSPSVSAVPKKSGMSGTIEGAERKRDMMAKNLRKNGDKYPRQRGAYEQHAKHVESWSVVELTMREVK